MPLMVRPLEMVARISAPTRTRGRLPRPPASDDAGQRDRGERGEDDARARAGLASVTSAVVTSPAERGADRADDEASTLYRSLWIPDRRTASALPPTAMRRIPSRVWVRKTVRMTNSAAAIHTGAGMPS